MKSETLNYQLPLIVGLTTDEIYIVSGGRHTNRPDKKESNPGETKVRVCVKKDKDGLCLEWEWSKTWSN
jgi:hypothetical protein